MGIFVLILVELGVVSALWSGRWLRYSKLGCGGVGCVGAWSGCGCVFE